MRWKERQRPEANPVKRYNDGGVCDDDDDGDDDGDDRGCSGHG